MASEQPNELALRETNETLTNRVDLLREQLGRAERDKEDALAQGQEMADRLRAAGME